MGSYNIDSILEDVLSVMDPNIIRMLKIEKEKKDHNSMLMNLKEIIKCAINNDPSTSIEEEIKDPMFKICFADDGYINYI